MPLEAAWMKLANVILIEVSQSEENKYYMTHSHVLYDTLTYGL